MILFIITGGIYVNVDITIELKIRGMWCKSKVFVGKQDIKYYREIIACIVITLINIKSSRNINCDLWSTESSSTTSNILTSLSLNTFIDLDVVVNMIIL